MPNYCFKFIKFTNLKHVESFINRPNLQEIDLSKDLNWIQSSFCFLPDLGLKYELDPQS